MVRYNNKKIILSASARWFAHALMRSVWPCVSLSMRESFEFGDYINKMIEEKNFHWLGHYIE